MAGLFGFFDYTKPRKGIRKDELAKTGVILSNLIFAELSAVSMMDVLVALDSTCLRGNYNY